MDDHTDVVFRLIQRRLTLHIRERLRRFSDLLIDEEDILAVVYEKLKRQSIELSPEEAVTAVPGENPAWLRLHYLKCLRYAENEVRRTTKLLIRRKKKLREYASKMEKPADPTAYEKIVREERQDRIVATLAMLDSDTETIVRLHIYDGMSLAEISRLLGTTVGKVKGKWQRGLKELASLLVKEDK